MQQLITTLTKIWDNIPKLYNNLLGFIITILTTYITWLGTAKGTILLVIIALIWDMLWGIAAALKQHKFVLSHLLRETFCKIIVYIGSLSIVLYAERTLIPQTQTTITIKILATIAVSIELFSSAGNILIIKPDFIFVRLFSKYLIGEIADKMKITHQEAQNILNKPQPKKHNNNEQN